MITSAPDECVRQLHKLEPISTGIVVTTVTAISTELVQ
jgi:hypothetical protein